MFDDGLYREGGGAYFKCRLKRGFNREGLMGCTERGGGAYFKCRLKRGFQREGLDKVFTVNIVNATRFMLA